MADLYEWQNVPEMQDSQGHITRARGVFLGLFWTAHWKGNQHHAGKTLTKYQRQCDMEKSKERHLQWRPSSSCPVSKMITALLSWHSEMQAAGSLCHISRVQFLDSYLVSQTPPRPQKLPVCWGPLLALPQGHMMAMPGLPIAVFLAFFWKQYDRLGQDWRLTNSRINRFSPAKRLFSATAWPTWVDPQKQDFVPRPHSRRTPQVLPTNFLHFVVIVCLIPGTKQSCKACPRSFRRGS